MKTICKICGILAAVYAALFAVFYFDLDGKLLYYIWEPFAVRRYDNMKRQDNTKTPYSMKDILPADNTRER